MTPTNFPAALRRELERRGLGVREFARMLDVDPGAVSRWLSGDREPLLGVAFRIADALGIKLDRLRE